jgi:hypothetical protein
MLVRLPWPVYAARHCHAGAGRSPVSSRWFHCVGFSTCLRRALGNACGPAFVAHAKIVQAPWSGPENGRAARRRGARGRLFARSFGAPGGQRSAERDVARGGPVDRGDPPRRRAGARSCPDREGRPAAGAAPRRVRIRPRPPLNAHTSDDCCAANRRAAIVSNKSKILAMPGAPEMGPLNLLQFAVSFGADAVLRKPFDAPELLKASQSLPSRLTPPSVTSAY